MADRQITFDLIARDQASQAINRVGQSAQSSGRQLESLGGGGLRMGSMLKAGAAAGAAALGALVVAGASVGVKTAAAMEQAEIAFGQLLGSGEKAKAFLQDLTQFAASTPFELQGLVESSRLLIGVGATTDQTKRILQDFGDTAGALGIQGEAFNRIILATSQAMSAGKFQAGDLNQIMTNGIPIWSILSKATGKSVSELRDMSEKGKLLASDVMPALHAQMQKDYGGAMAKQAQTLNGLWSTFKDTISLGLAQAVQPLLPMLKDGLGGAASFLATAFGWLSTAVQTVIGWFRSATGEGSTVSGVMDSLRGSVKSLRDAWNDHQKAVGIVVAIFKVWMAYLRGIVLPIVGEVVKLVGFVLTPIFRGLASAIEFVFPVIKALAGQFLWMASTLIHAAADAFAWIPGVGPKLAAAAQQFDRFRDSVNASLAGIQSRTVTVAFGAVFTPGSGDIFRKYGGIGSGAGVLKTGSASVTLAPAAIPKAPSYSNFGGGGGAGSGGGGSKKKAGPTAAGKDFWDGIIASFKEAEPGIGKVLDRWSDKIAKVKITEKTRTRLTGIVQTIADALEKDTAKLKQVKDRITEQKKALDDLIKSRSDYADKLAAGVSGGGLATIKLAEDVTDAEGNVTKVDKVAAFVESLRQRSTAITDFNSNLAALQKLGASENTLRQLAEAGVETGGTLAAALAQGTPQAIAEIEKLQSSITQQSNVFGEKWASSMYDAGIAAAQGLLKGLQSQQATIEAHVDQLGRLLMQRMASALGVAAPVMPASVTPIAAKQAQAQVVYNLHPQGLVTGTAADVARYLEKTIQQAGQQGVKVNLKSA